MFLGGHGDVSLLACSWASVRPLRRHWILRSWLAIHSASAKADLRAPCGAGVIILHDRPLSAPLAPTSCSLVGHHLLACRPHHLPRATHLLPGSHIHPTPRAAQQSAAAAANLPPRVSDPDHRFLYSLHPAGGTPARAYRRPTPPQPPLARRLRVDDGREPGDGVAPPLPNLHSRRASSPSLPYSRSTLC